MYSATAMRAQPFPIVPQTMPSSRLELLPDPKNPNVRLSPAELKAQSVAAWLWSSSLCYVDPDNKVRLQGWVRRFRDDPVCVQRRGEMCAACPGLDDRMARALCQMLIDRAHAERADFRTVQKGLEPQLRRFFELQEARQPLYSVRVPDGEPELLFLRGPHYDGCLFNPSAQVSKGGNGRFLIGMTPYHHPVAVKMMLLADGVHPRASQDEAQLRRAHFAREAFLTRGAGVFDILHLFNTEQNQFMVMRLFNGDLHDHALAFFSLYTPPDGSGYRQNGLFGARYVLRHLVAAMADLHKCGVVHEDIKARNIFLQIDRRKFVLGDLGIASVVRDNDQAQLRGYTPTFAAPEQFGLKRHIDSKVDIFGLAATMFYLLTTKCPPVMAYRRDRFPRQSASGLFAYDEDVPRMHHIHRAMLFQALDGSSYRSESKYLDPKVYCYQKHFQSIHESVNHFDLCLGDLLRQMLQHDPAKRPGAADIGRYMDEKLTVDDDCIQQVQAVWATQIPKFSATITDRIEELDAAIDRIFPNGPRANPS